MSPQLALHVSFRGIRGFRWPLRDDDDVEVWTTANELYVTLPGRLVRNLVELHLAGVTLQRQVSSLVLPRKPPAALPRRGQSAEDRSTLRQKRRSRRRL